VIQVAARGKEDGTFVKIDFTEVALFVVRKQP